MKKTFLIPGIMMLMFIPALLSAQGGIQFFHGSWAEILAKAKESNKLIFMDAYAEWCGPCKRMAADVFPLEEVGDYYNSTFIPVKIDMEKGEGKAISRLYNVRAYPTLLFIDWKGEVVHRAIGGRNSEGLIALGKEALDDSKNFRSVSRKYQMDPLDIDNILAYCEALKKTYDKSYIPIISTYLDQQDEDILLTETGWKIISLFVEDPESKPFLYLLEHKQQFEDKFGKEEIHHKIHEVITIMIQGAVRQKDAEIMQNLRTRISEMPVDGKDYFLSLADVLYLQRQGDWTGYGKAVIKLISHSPEITPFDLNQYAWNFYLHVDDPKDLAQITELVAKTIKSKDEYALHDTYAALLHKTGKNKQALKEAKAAVVLAQKEGAPYEETLELILEIEKSLKK